MGQAQEGVADGAPAGAESFRQPLFTDGLVETELSRDQVGTDGLADFVSGKGWISRLTHWIKLDILRQGGQSRLLTIFCRFAAREGPESGRIQESQLAVRFLGQLEARGDLAILIALDLPDVPDEGVDFLVVPVP